MNQKAQASFGGLASIFGKFHGKFWCDTPPEPSGVKVVAAPKKKEQQKYTVMAFVLLLFTLAQAGACRKPRVFFWRHAGRVYWSYYYYRGRCRRGAMGRPAKIIPGFLCHAHKALWGPALGCYNRYHHKRKEDAP
ncbi:hypothetical protein [uncultured Allofournierella sp.]|uniref:hypothetical protein n=1 Tax=uncultured Allofournierella sp. TaxID=1940258 RepID=UPI0025D54E96|nr:hypothetical protein [uncultured Fournierella sp.]